MFYSILDALVIGTLVLLPMLLYTRNTTISVRVAASVATLTLIIPETGFVTLGILFMAGVYEIYRLTRTRNKRSET
jgi:uncharacterized integral membrane protein